MSQAIRVTASTGALLARPDKRGTYFAVTLVNFKESIRAAGLQPKAPYFEYRLIDGSWQRQPVADQRAGWKSNLLLSIPLAREDPFVSLSMKRSADANPGFGMAYRCVQIANQPKC
jgi:hypothetical protein